MNIFQSNMSLSRIENVAECCDVPATQQLHIWAANVLPLNIFFHLAKQRRSSCSWHLRSVWCHQQPPKLGISVTDYYFFATSRVQDISYGCLEATIHLIWLRIPAVRRVCDSGVFKNCDPRWQHLPSFPYPRMFELLMQYRGNLLLLV